MQTTSEQVLEPFNHSKTGPRTQTLIIRLQVEELLIHQARWRGKLEYLSQQISVFLHFILTFYIPLRDTYLQF